MAELEAGHYPFRPGAPHPVELMPQPLYCFFGHHKCASTWIHSILDQVVADTGHRLAYLYDAKLFDEDLPAYLEKNRFEFVSYVNADLRYTKDLENVRGFHVVRDPRDLLVSAYFSHKGTHPTHAWEELIPHREKLNQVDKQEGLLLEMDFNNDFLEQIATWDYDQPDILELKQEEFAPDPYRGFLQVFQHLGLLDDSHYNKQRWIPYLLRSSTNIANRLSSGAWPLRMKMGAIPGERLLGIVYDLALLAWRRTLELGPTADLATRGSGASNVWCDVQIYEAFAYAHYRASFSRTIPSMKIYR